jgi:hypothetical protein
MWILKKKYDYTGEKNMEIFIGTSSYM